MTPFLTLGVNLFRHFPVSDGSVGRTAGSSPPAETGGGDEPAGRHDAEVSREGDRPAHQHDDGRADNGADEAPPDDSRTAAHRRTPDEAAPNFHAPRYVRTSVKARG